MTNNQLNEILKLGFSEDELKKLVIGDVIRSPGIRGCFQLGKEWFLYDGQDEMGNIDFIGPFNDKAIVYAIAIKFYKTSNFKEYKFSEEEMDVFCDNHFFSIEEIRERYDELWNLHTEQKN